MTVIKFKIDVTNENHCLSKDYGLTIKAGTELEFETISENVQRLLKIGVAEEINAVEEIDPAIHTDGELEGEGASLEDLTKAELESFAKENDLNIEFSAKATKAEMIRMIEAALK